MNAKENRKINLKSPIFNLEGDDVEKYTEYKKAAHELYLATEAMVESGFSRIEALVYLASLTK